MSSKIRVNGRLVNGQMIMILINKNANVATLKQEILKRYPLPSIHDLHLFFNSKEINDSDTIVGVGIEDDDVFHILINAQSNLITLKNP